jgi:hypothetical protein
MKLTLRPLTLALAAALLVAAPASAHEEEKAPFGPWDAGDKREVKRQGRKGKSRRAHPSLGDPAKVPASGPPPPPLRRDADIPESALPTVNVVGSSLSANPLFLAALVYSSFITKMDGPRCKHYPTCSRFANQAVARHGAIGIPMGLDRLIQDGASSVLRGLPEMEVGESMRHFDPLSNYEFWRADQWSAFLPPADEEPLELAPVDDDKRASTRDDEAVAKTKKSLPSG